MCFSRQEYDAYCDQDGYSDHSCTDSQLGRENTGSGWFAIKCGGCKTMLATDLRWRRVFVAACPACMQFTRWSSFLIGPDDRACDGYAVPTQQWARLVRERVSNVVTAVVVEPIPQEQDRPTPLAH